MKLKCFNTMIFLSVSVMLVITGCAKDTGVMLAKDGQSNFDGAVYEGEIQTFVEDIGDVEQYRVFQQGATGFIPLSVVSREVEEQAYKFCDNKGMALKKIKEIKSIPPHILGNFPRAELLFACVAKPNLLEDQLYIRLSNLKKLLDDGAITKEEYDQQKSKILNKN